MTTESISPTESQTRVLPQTQPAGPQMTDQASLRGGEAAVALAGGIGARQKCYTCGKAIFDEHWFCRIARGTERIVLCCPSCTISYLDGSTPNGKLVNGRSPEKNTAASQN